MEQHQLCPECYRASIDAKRAAASEAAARESEEIGLPDLEGSEKQVAWALRLRAEALKNLSENLKLKVPRFFSKLELKHEMTDVLSAFEALALNWAAGKTSASWWIDSREAGWLDLFAKEERVSLERLQTAVKDGLSLDVAAATVEAEKSADQMDERDIANAETMEPQERLSPLVAGVNIHSTKVTVRFPEKNEALRTCVKQVGFRWAEVEWVKDCVAGEVDDAAVEVAWRLLKAGFRVRLAPEEVRMRVAAGQFRPHTTRRVFWQPDQKKFRVQWDRESGDDFYEQAKRLPGAKWSKELRSMLVPLEAWESVEDFAERQGFRLSPGAEKAVAAGREADARSLKVQLGAEPEMEKPVNEMEPATGEVDDDLRDD
ncbi:MAG TPA: hypothetical protein PK490_19810 [Prosthecobacter sp.]|nr:hypothetical protein [Prosthecobacter sp.]